MRRILILCQILWLFFLIQEASANRLKGQAVTWADFNYVNYVASSMSHVYFATTGGITRFNKLEERWELPLTGADGLEDETPQRIWVDRFDDIIYVRTGMGLYEHDRLFDRWYSITEVPDLNSDDRHIMTPEDLLPSSEFNFIESGSVIDTYFRRFAITDVVDDMAGNLWIGTWGHGTGMAGSSVRLMKPLSYGLIQNRVNTLYLDDGLLWIAGWLGNSYRTGLSAFHIDENEFSYLESGVLNDFPAADINCLEGDSLTLFIGTSDGLYAADINERQVIRHYLPKNGLADYEIMSLARQGDSLFVGTSGGLNLLEFATDSISHVYSGQFFNHNIYDLEVIGDYLWIASDIGAYRLSLEDHQLQRFEDPHSVLFAGVLDIEPSGDLIWFASDGGVLSLDTKTGETDPFRDIVRRSNSRALAVNDRIVAVASDRGLTIIFLNDRKRYSREFTTDDGLASDEVYALLLDGDYLWVGTDRGLTRFLWNNPERVN